MIIAESSGANDTLLTIDGEKKLLLNCSPLKLMNTIYGREGTPQYTEEEMENWGLYKKGKELP